MKTGYDIKNYWDRAAAVDSKIRHSLEERGIKYPSLGFFIEEGWLDPVFRALDEMIKIGWDKDLHQVKQKFCQLRMYIGDSTAELQDIIAKAENECDRLCEICGGDRKDEGYGWGMALCESCKEAENLENTPPSS